VGHAVPGAVGLGLALALSSTALVIPIAGTDGPVGRAAFGMLLFEDLALVPIIFGLGALRPGAGGDALGDMGLTLLKGIVAVAVLLVAGRLLLPRLFAQAARTKSPELFLSASLLVVILASITTTAVGLSPIVGALIAGILIAETDYHDEVEVITAPFQGLALGVFLITVGMRLDVQQLLANWRPLLLATVAIVAVKAAVTGGLLRFLGFRAGVAAETGLLMAAPSETTLIVLATAVEAHLISPGNATFWQTCTALGLMITPLLALAGNRAARLIERRAPEPESPPSADPDRTVVIGYGRVGKLVAEMLARHDRAFSVIDADVDAVARGRADGVPIAFGDVSRLPMLDRLELGDARAVVLTMDNAVQLVRTTAAIRRLHPDLPIISRARETRHAAELYRAGATEAVPETLEASLQLSGAALVEIGVAMGPVIASLHQKRAELRERLQVEGETERGQALRRW
jgi:CPA2 family monovalent cation:H+ antiporter-2